MRVALGMDHGGVPLREPILELLHSLGHQVLDFGTFEGLKPVDYPDFAKVVGEAVQRGDADRGLLICGSGVGAAIAANKLKDVRAGLCHDTYSAHQGVEHDNMNVLCLGGRVVGVEIARELVKAFLTASFSGEDRHCRRLAKVAEMEQCWPDS
jgi:ribose 5-phosphate isomerase B